MKPTAPLRYNFSVFATTPCRGLSLSRQMIVREERSAHIDRLFRVVAGLLCLAVAICAGYIAAIGIVEAIRLFQASQTPHSGWFGFSMFLCVLSAFTLALFFVASRLLLRGRRII